MFLVGGGVAPPGGDRDRVVTQQRTGAAYPEWLIQEVVGEEEPALPRERGAPEQEATSGERWLMPAFRRVPVWDLKPLVHYNIFPGKGP